MNKIIVQLLHQPFWCKTYDSISIQYENVIESVCARVMDNNLKQEIILSGLLNLGTMNSSGIITKHFGKLRHDVNKAWLPFSSSKQTPLNFRSSMCTYHFTRVLECWLGCWLVASSVLVFVKRFAGSATSTSERVCVSINTPRILANGITSVPWHPWKLHWL